MTEYEYKIKMIKGEGLQQYDVDGSEVGTRLVYSSLPHMFDVHEIELISEFGNRTENLETRTKNMESNLMENEGLWKFLKGSDSEDETKEIFSKYNKEIRAKLKTGLTKNRRKRGEPLEYYIIGSKEPIEEFTLSISNTQKDKEYLVVSVYEGFYDDGVNYPSGMDIKVFLLDDAFEELYETIGNTPKPKMIFTCDIDGTYSEKVYTSSFDVSSVSLLEKKTMDTLGLEREISHLNRALVDENYEFDDKFEIIIKNCVSDVEIDEDNSDEILEQDSDELYDDITDKQMSEKSINLSWNENPITKHIVPPLWIISALLLLNIFFN